MSALWGVADAGTQALIVEAHHARGRRRARLLGARGRRHPGGRRAGNGAVAQADVVGVAATAYDHWDSRAGDPQLHTHVVVSNKVQTTDGRAVAQPGRAAALHASVVALSEHYNAVLADRSRGSFGIEWEHATAATNRNPAWEMRRRRRGADRGVLQPITRHRAGEATA